MAVSSGYNPVRDSIELASLASSGSRSAAGPSSAGGERPSREFDFVDDDPLAAYDDDDEAAAGRPRSASGRTPYSATAAIDFGTHLYPLSQTAAYDVMDARRHRLERNKTLTFFNGLSLVIGLIIGGGIFSSPSQVNSHTGSPGGALIAWSVAGVLAWTGAACFAELGSAIPLNGGAQVYLALVYGEWFGFVFTWAAVLMLKPASAAIIAIIFGEYVVQAVAGTETVQKSLWICKAVGFFMLIFVTLVNCVSKKVSTRTADWLMMLKFLALIAVMVTGIIVAATGLSYGTDKRNTGWKELDWFGNTSSDPAEWAVALYAGLWAYDGWDNVNFVAGEFANPTRDIPRVIHTAMPLVIFFYIVANISYYLVLTPEVIQSSNTVAVAFGSAAYGPVGAALFALAVSGSCFGALNASTFSSGRLVYSAGKEGYLPELFGRIGIGSRAGIPPDSAFLPTRHRYSRIGRFVSWLAEWIADDDGAGFFHTPVNAMVLNACLSSIYVFVGEFNSLLSFCGVVGYSFMFFVVLGVIILRVREPQLERKYQTWITTPIAFCCVCLFLVSRTAFSEPLKMLAVFGFVGLGLPVYWWRIGRKKGRKATTSMSLLSSLNRGSGFVPVSRPEPTSSANVRQYPSWQVWRRWI